MDHLIQVDDDRVRGLSHPFPDTVLPGHEHRRFNGEERLVSVSRKTPPIPLDDCALTGCQRHHGLYGLAIAGFSFALGGYAVFLQDLVKHSTSGMEGCAPRSPQDRGSSGGESSSAKNLEKEGRYRLPDVVRQEHREITGP